MLMYFLFILQAENHQIYGISQNSNTKDYIVVLKNVYCEKCDEEYTYESYKSCKKCQINYLKNDFSNWSSENVKIDNLIQAIQLKTESPWDIVFEWIPHNQFNNIKKIKEADFTKIYSATWKSDILYYNCLYKKEQARRLDSKVTLINLTDKVIFYKFNLNNTIYTF